VNNFLRFVPARISLVEKLVTSASGVFGMKLAAVGVCTLHNLLIECFYKGLAPLLSFYIIFWY